MDTIDNCNTKKIGLKKISIIIVTYNSENDIFDCLESVYKFNDIGKELEIIIVDNNSTNVKETFRKIHDVYPEITLIKNTQNEGYGAGNNIGIKYSNAQIIMIMNPDVRLIEPVFSTALQHFEDNDVSMYGMKQILPSGGSGASFFWTLLDNPLISILKILKYYRPRDSYLQDKMYLSGSCFFIRKQDFERTGLFDKKIFLYAEEDDIRIRLLSLGNKKIIYDKNKKYIHNFENREITLIKLQRLFVSKCYLFRKNGLNQSIARKWEIQYYRVALFLNFLNKNKNSQKIKVYRNWLGILKKNELEEILSKNINDLI